MAMAPCSVCTARSKLSSTRSSPSTRLIAVRMAARYCATSLRRISSNTGSIGGMTGASIASAKCSTGALGAASTPARLAVGTAATSTRGTRRCTTRRTLSVAAGAMSARRASCWPAASRSAVSMMALIGAVGAPSPNSARRNCGKRIDGATHHFLHALVGRNRMIQHTIEHVLHLPGEFTQHGGADQSAGALQGVEGAANGCECIQLRRIGEPGLAGGMQAVDFFLHFLQEDVADVVVDSCSTDLEARFSLRDAPATGTCSKISSSISIQSRRRRPARLPADRDVRCPPDACRRVSCSGAGGVSLWPMISRRQIIAMGRG